MENNWMYIHHTAGPLQESGSLSRRQRHLSDLMVICNLGNELGDRASQEALLDSLVRHAAELMPVTFSKVLSREQDGSFVCRAIFQNFPYNETFRKNQPVPAAAWPFYARVSSSGREPTVIRKKDPNLSEEQRRALGLKAARRVWIVPLKDGAKQVGVFVLGERAGGSSKMELSQMETISRIAEQVTIAVQGTRCSTAAEDSFIKIILALAEAIDSADPDSHHHGYRTANIAVAVANQFSLTEEQIQNLRWASMLHDIGKVEISEEILCKPGPLSAEEWEIMRRHPLIGAEILQPVARLNAAAALILAHHERYDGSGYPYGLHGDEIPLEARILAAADAYSVMIQGRVYRGALTQAQAVAELKRCSGSDFDPQVIEALLALIDLAVIN
jgi:HD-GYP domain-containing protein (c-di-GMP phosphodiesterase class II)